MKARKNARLCDWSPDPARSRTDPQRTKPGLAGIFDGSVRLFVPKNEPTRISPSHLTAAGRSVFNSFQDVKDQSSSGVGIGNPREPDRTGQKVESR